MMTPVSVTLLQRSSFPFSIYSVYFHRSTSCRSMHETICFEAISFVLFLLSLQVSFLSFTELMKLPLHTVQTEVSTFVSGRLLGH